ncbi:MAG: hypothetical protein J0H02_04790 [Armatimonadetes bacterium]|nr:hypothetical protein [Armatimonadota bacterium]
MKNRSQRPIWVLLLLCALYGVAGAQLVDLTSTKDGRGTLRFITRSSTSTINRIRVSLRRDGYAEISVLSGASETFSGRWSNDGSRACRIDIRNVGRDAASGSGYVRHDGRGGITDVTMSGTMRGVRFELDFSASGSGGGLTNLSSTREGTGNLKFMARSSNSRVTRLSVNLRSNSDFEIRTLSGVSETWKGRWWQDGRNKVRIDIDHLGNEYASGSGSIELDERGSFEKVTLSGSIRNLRYELDFRSSRDHDQPENNRFLKSAREAVRKKFSSSTSFNWNSESVGNAIFGRVTVRGEFTARNGSQPGRYRYTVILGAGTANVQSVSYSRI